MAVPAEPNTEALASLIQVQGQGLGQPLVQGQQVQAQEQQPQAQAQQPQAPAGTPAAQIQVGEVFCMGDPKRRNGGMAEWRKIAPNPNTRNDGKSPQILKHGMAENSPKF